MKLKDISSSFDDFLKEEGMLAEAEAVAVKRVIAYQIQQSMDKEHISKAEMAKKMGTSRSSINRLLDPMNTSVTLQTIEKAVTALGKKVQIQIM